MGVILTLTVTLSLICNIIRAESFHADWASTPCDHRFTRMGVVLCQLQLFLLFGIQFVRTSFYADWASQIEVEITTPWNSGTHFCRAATWPLSVTAELRAVEHLEG